MKKIIVLLVLVLTTTANVNAQNGLDFKNANSNRVLTNQLGITGNNPRTMEAWIKLDDVTGGYGIVCYGKNSTANVWNFRTDGNLLRVEVSGGFIKGSTPLVPGVWTHVACTFSGTTISDVIFYIDGNVDPTGSMSPTNIAINTNVSANGDYAIGAGNAHSYFFNGAIDEVRVWDVARTQAELAANMNSEFCSTPTGMVLYQKFNQGTAGGTNTGLNTANGELGSIGTLQNYTLTGTASNWVTGSGIAVANASTSLQTFTECSGFSTIVNGNSYNTTGVYTDVLFGAASNGCDSIITTDLTIVSAGTFNQTLVECSGYSITVNGNTYNTTGVYTDVLTGAAANGCDSIITTNLTVQVGVSSSQTMVECAGFSIDVNGTTYNTTGTITEVIVGGSFGGCDSTVNIDLTVLPAVSSSVTLVNCPGDAVAISGTVYANAGVYTVVLAGAAASGCDSTVNLDLSFFAPVTNAVTMNECAGFSTVIDGTTYDANGTYTLFYNNASVNGCDSTVTLDLTIAPAIDVTTTATDTSITAVNTNGTYQWIDCGSGNAEIPTETNQTFEATANGSYAVIVTEGNCSDTSACVSISVIGLEENAIANSIKVYPNPTNGKVNIELSQVQNATIIVTDNMGREIHKMNASESIVTIDLAGFDKGIYFFNIQSSEVNTVTSIVLH